MDRVISLMHLDVERLQALEYVRLLDLPQCYIAAGFVRNLIWDHLHQNLAATPLNDVDVIYYDVKETEPDKNKEYQCALYKAMPKLNWQVKNQALMHIKNNDDLYTSTLDAMRYWPEKETAIGIRKLASGKLEGISGFGVESLFNLQLTHNPRRLQAVFEGRVRSKGWLAQWPNLNIAREDTQI